MRTTGTNDQVAHVWAQDKGQPMRSGSMRAEGDTVYSYGTHFPIARWTDATGRDYLRDSARLPRRVVLFTTARHSVTTSQHIGRVWRALGYRDAFMVPNVRARDKAAHLENLRAMIATAHEDFEKAKRARKYGDSHLESGEKALRSADLYRRAFGLRYKMPAPNLESLRTVTAAARAKADAEDRARRAANEAEYQRREKERAEQLAAWRIEDAAELAAWHAGEPVRFPSRTFGGNPAYLRRIGETVHTSQGAEFPWPDALRGWSLVQRVKAAGEPWTRNGDRLPLGHFEIDRIDADGNVRAGCHVVPFAEIARLMAREGIA